MIVSAGSFSELERRVTLVDGGFDPLHPGHVAYLRAAAGLGLPVLCNVSSDEWIERKHPPLLSQEQRCELIDAIRFVDYTHASRGSTAEVLAALRPRFYAKGKDWNGRLPHEEIDICAHEEIEIVYLDTVLDSSTEILRRLRDRL